MKTCKVCGEPYRKGQIVHIMGERGLQAVRACQKCAGKGVTLVATNPVTFCKCGNPATKCHICAGSSQPAGDIAAALKQLEGRLKLIKMSPAPTDEKAAASLSGRIEGMESAIALLKSGKF